MNEVSPVLKAKNRRRLAWYVLATITVVVYAGRIEVINDHAAKALDEACIAANQTADVWNRLIATSIVNERAGNDPEPLKTKKIADLAAVKFPTQQC